MIVQTEKSTATIRGALERIIWQDGRRLIAAVKPHNRAPVTVIGDMADPRIGQEYEFTGRWRKNERFNKWDLMVDTYRTLLPDDSSGIYHYLVRIAKWIGPETATALIERFGDDTLRVLKEDPNAVLDARVRGLTAERVKIISETLVKNEKLEHAMVEVGNLVGGVLRHSAIKKAIAKWGPDAAHIIKRNAFRLIELPGVGFTQADAIHFKLGGQESDRRRHAEAALHVIRNQANRDGHTIISTMTFESEFRKLVQTPNTRTVELLTRAKAATCQDHQIADADLYDAERRIAYKIQQLLADESPKWVPSTEAQECVLRGVLDELASDQQKALDIALGSNVAALTGPPGTGKTYTIARILRIWREAGLRIALCAPTGKAAKQMQLALAGENIGRPMTIHSLLEPEIDDNGDFRFTRTASNPLDCSALVVDETSMVDVRLMRSLLDAVPLRCRILFVGDNYQLPSVGPGAVLRDMLAAGVPHHELTEIKRNAGRIVVACHAIKDGCSPQPAPKLNLELGDNWRHIASSSSENVKQVIEKLLADKLPAMGIDPIWQTQIISPVNEKGPLSCATLNTLAKTIVNPNGKAEKLAFNVNDKIVRTKNGEAVLVGENVCPTCEGETDGDLCATCMGKGVVGAGSTRIVNGDIGVVREINEKNIVVDFMYPNRRVKLSRRDHELRLAYCMTCHKMQGSEIDVVILPIRPSLMGIPMVTREWLYTAMSRAKKFILTIGDLASLEVAIRRVGNTKRTTNLVHMLRGGLAA